MNTATNDRLIATKSVLWFLVGVAGTAIVLRFMRGLGPSTALTDLTPWGIWIGLDVMAGVALAGGGFVMAAAVHVLGREKYHGLLRPAILTAFLGYLAVIIGLMVDLGRPWNIWRPLFHQNLHSPLFEVAMCVMIYTAVLALEFAPVGLDPIRRAKPIIRLLRRLTLPLVILGICLSTLHQSSLGTLFLLTEDRMHPLWYSPTLPLLFLISAVGLGMAMVSLESMLSSWLYKKEAEWPQLAGLTRAAAFVLGIYLVLRLGDLLFRGQIGSAFDGSWFATLFWVEIGMSALIPMLLFTLPQSRGTRWGIAWGATLAVAGFVLHRADVGGISHLAVTQQGYMPALSEIVVSLGVISGLGLIFLFCIEHLDIWEEKPAAPDPFTPPIIDPISRQFIRAPWFGGTQRAMLALIVGIIVGLGLMEAQFAWRAQTVAQTVRPPRVVLAESHPRDNAPGHRFELVDYRGPTTTARTNPDSSRIALLLDGGESGRFVFFGHEAHQERLGGQSSCTQCHHRNVPLDRGTSCASCHTDMYRTTDTFDHGLHTTAYERNQGCVVCHPDPALPKSRTASTACDKCHPPVPPEETRARSTVDLTPGMAPGYKQALHGLCIECHRDHEADSAVATVDANADSNAAHTAYLTLCTTCHRTEIPDRFEPPVPSVDVKSLAAGLTARSTPLSSTFSSDEGGN